MPDSNDARSSGVVGRLRTAAAQITRRLSSAEQPKCKHEGFDATVDYDENNMWHLQDTYLRGDTYWTATDAAFGKTRGRVKEFRCLGCGEERTITTGEVLEYRWKDEMTTEEIAEMHEQTNSGSWFNGCLWWEDNVWGGEATDVASPMQWHIDIGYTEWKEDSEPDHDEVVADAK